MKYEVVVHDDGRKIIGQVEIDDVELARIKQTFLCSIFYGVIIWY